MVIVLPFVGSVKEYIAAILARGCPLTQPDDCPHPNCQASGSLIRWGTYERRAATEEVDYRIRIQRLRCKVCGRTHSLLPDFLHPHRHFVLALLYRIVALYLIEGWNWESLMNKLPGTSPARSTIREWVGSFAYGAGQLLLDALLRHLLALAPHTEVSWKRLTAFGCWPRLSMPRSRPGSLVSILEQAISSLFCFTGCKASPFHRDCSGHRPCPAHLPRLSKPIAGIV